MGSKNKKQRKGERNEAKGSDGVAAAAEEGKQMITDPRFSSAHTDPRFRRVPRRETKVAIDSRFKRVFTDKRFTTGSAPVDKRGKQRRGGSGKDALREYYRIEEEEEEKKTNKDNEEDSEEESDDKSKSEQEMMDLKSNEEESEEDSKSEIKHASSDEESNEESESEEENELSEEEQEEEEDDTDEEDEAFDDYDAPEIPEENIPIIPKETHRLALVNMDWRYVSAKDLYVVLNSFVPKDGRILSVAVYPTEFGLQRMKEEEIHGPVIDGDKKNEDDEEEEEEEEDEDVTNQKLRAYEISRLKYYFAVAECDSVATADYLYKSCDGIEFERSSNKLDLRFIPDSMEFKHPPRDISTEAPAGYEGLDFQSRALQLSKVDISWDEDEPHRVKTLNQKFTPDQLADLEMKEYFASDDSESDDDDNYEGVSQSKEEKRKERYRSLVGSGDVDSDKDVEDENDQDMEVTFNTGLEDLNKEILKKKDQKSETVWEAVQRKKQEKKRARKNKQNDDSEDDDDYNIDGKAMKDDGDDDFFMEEPPLKKKKKEGKTKKKKKGLEEEVAADEELELLLADENAGEGKGVKGYNIKRKGKKGKMDISEEKIPASYLDEPRFAALLSSPSYALDPTDPQFKRSATYARQLAAKQKEDPKSHEDVKYTAPKERQELSSDAMLESKKERYELTSTVKSLKMKMKNKDTEKKIAANAESSSTLAQRIKKKAKDLSKK